MRGSTNRGRYQCSRAGAGVCPVSFGLSLALLTSGSPPAATPDKVITLYREAVALLPAEHPLRAGLYNNLATALWTRYEMAGSSHLFDKMITVDRETLALRPAGHPDRFMSCNELAVTLLTCYEMTGTTDLLDEAIALHREALALQPAGHPYRAMLCNNLASALHTRYEMTGAADLLDEAVTLHREALALCPAGHTFRASACNNLAITLRGRYEVTGDSGLLDESITLLREALALQPVGHPDRGDSCNNLANALQTRYEMTGSSDLLDEAITLLREALALCPVGPPLRAGLCSNLANALWARYKMTGSSDLLDEAITLYRESLALRPAAHPDRASSCNNLANALRARYNETDSSDLLDESITLQREALALRPAGHPDRSMSCSNLANALWTRYEITGSSDLLDETIALHREALALRLAGHPDRSASCIHVANQLLQRFRQTHDLTFIDEALLLARESAASSSPSSLCEALLILCDVHMEQDSPHLSISTATKYLAQASALFYDSPTTLTEAISSRLTLIWSLRSTWTNDIPQLLLSTYTNLIDRLSRMTGFTIDTVSQLTALRSARSFGSDAFVAALIAGHPRQAAELVDHAHGVIWAQALHQRNPQLQDIPESIASELESLLRAVSVPVATDALTLSEPATRHLSLEDVRHQQNSQVQMLLTEVRAMPGLDRFMLGKTYAELRETAHKHPVVVLASAHGLVYALIIRNLVQEHPDVLPLKLTSDRLALLRHTATQAGLRTRNVMQDIELGSYRQMRPGRFKDTALGTLADLWQEIVKPVLAHLQLTVRIWPTHMKMLTLISAH
jgi:tetratricopeptide (TPR) repeat protein